MSTEKLEEFLTHLKGSFELLKKEKSLGIGRNFEIYRGDSFQIVLDKPNKSLRVALLLRSSSRMSQSSVTTSRQKLYYSNSVSSQITDLRLAVGIGTINKLANKLMESDGQAFHLSGRLIDSMKKPGVNLAINTSSEKANKELEASWGLIDAVVNRWTVSQAEVVYFSLMGYNQIEIATDLETSPSAINQRLKAASWSAIEKMVVYFEETILEKIEANGTL